MGNCGSEATKKREVSAIYGITHTSYVLAVLFRVLQYQAKISVFMKVTQTVSPATDTLRDKATALASLLGAESTEHSASG